MKSQLINYIRAGYPGLYIVSAEEQRVGLEITAAADAVKFNLFVWSFTKGLIKVIDDQNSENLGCEDPLDCLAKIAELDEKSVVILRDFHLFMMDINPQLIRRLKDVLASGKSRNIVLIIVGCRLALLPELEKELTVLEFNLPDRAELNRVLDSITEPQDIKLPGGDLDAILDAASGLTTMEAENAFALSIIETQRVDPAIVNREKAATIKKNGILEIIHAHSSLTDVGGLDLLKEWVGKRRHAFGKRAREFSLPMPKGVLLVGIPGCGKSLLSKAIAAVLACPLLKFDVGKAFGSLVGESEEKMRTAIKTAEAVAPCVLWMDEIEKGLAGSRSSGSSDGGTTARVFGSFLTWLNEKTAPVFVVATANDIAQLPPELLRKGRFDEIWFIDLPNESEREQIWKIQIAKYNRNHKDFDTRQLARLSAEWTGSEIEAAFVEALYAAFDNNEEPSDLHIAQAATTLVPLSKTMSNELTALRKWAEGRARRATKPEQKLSIGRKLAA